MTKRSVAGWMVATAIGMATATVNAAPVSAPQELGDTAPFVAQIRLHELSAVLRRIGIDQLPLFTALKQQLGGINVLDPGLLTPMGFDPKQPLWASLFETSKTGDAYHHRVIAALGDATMFSVFLNGVIASEQTPLLPADPQSARLGVVGMLKLPDGGVGVLRISGDRLVLDTESRWDGRAPAWAQVAQKYPLKPAVKFALGAGAKRMFADETSKLAVVLHADGRRAPELAAQVFRREAKAAVKTGDAQAAKRLKTFEACKREVDASPSELTDFALVLKSEAKDVTLSAYWGAKHPLWASDANAVTSNLGTLSSGAALATLDVGRAMKLNRLRGKGVFTNRARLDSAFARCESYIAATLFARAWPDAQATFLSDDKKEMSVRFGQFGGAASAALKPNAVRQIVAGAQASADAKGLTYFVGAVLDPSLREVLLPLFALLSPETTKLNLGGRVLDLYRFGSTQTDEGKSTPIVGTLDTVGDRLIAIGATKQDAIAWALPGLSATRAVGVGEPVLAIDVPGAIIRGLVTGGAELTALVSRLLHARLTATEHDLLVDLSLSAAFKQP